MFVKMYEKQNEKGTSNVHFYCVALPASKEATV